ncbi:MAG: hypothetical protein ACREDM_11875 [Methylocella sp.]
MGQKEVTGEVLARHMVALLPQDGTPVLNRVMRVMLSRQLEVQVEPDLYFAARDQLLQSGKIGRLRGQSGQIFLAALNGSQPAAAGPKRAQRVQPCGVISCSTGVIAIIALSGLSPRHYKILRCSTAPIAPAGVAADMNKRDVNP